MPSKTKKCNIHFSVSFSLFYLPSLSSTLPLLQMYSLDCILLYVLHWNPYTSPWLWQLFSSPSKQEDSFSIRLLHKDLWSPRILLLTCSLDVTIWSMSVRSLASSGTLWASQASTSASYWPVVWDNTCLYTASEIWRRESFKYSVGLDLFESASCQHCTVKQELTSIQFLCLCCIFPFRRGPITFLNSGWRVSITRLARICTYRRCSLYLLYCTVKSVFTIVSF